jgi:PPP family 3-phenylpropionic acid transporter
MPVKRTTDPNRVQPGWHKMRKLWPFTFNFLLLAAAASASPFMVLYYQGLGFTGTQIGLLTGLVPLITLFSAPLWTGLADATHQHRLVMSVAILGAAITGFVFPLLGTFVPVLLMAVLLFVFIAPIVPLADSAAMFMLAGEEEMYPRVRLGGTIGYGVGASIAGLLVQHHGLRFAFWGCATLFLLGFIVSQKLVYGQSGTENRSRGRVRTLLTNPRWLLFLAIAFAGGTGLAAFNNYFFPYLKDLGANESTMGFAQSVGTISEIPILFFGNHLIKRLKPYGLLMWSMALIGLRLLLYAASATPGLVLLIQLLNGLTFPTMLVAGVSYADENAPAGMRTTAQGLFNAMVSGLGVAAGGFIGGPLLINLGGHGLYLVFGATVLVIVAIVALVQRRLPAEQRMSSNACPRWGDTKS